MIKVACVIFTIVIQTEHVILSHDRATVASYSMNVRTKPENTAMMAMSVPGLAFRTLPILAKYWQTLGNFGKGLPKVWQWFGNGLASAIEGRYYINYRGY